MTIALFQNMIKYLNLNIMENNIPTFEELISISEEEYTEKYLIPQLKSMGYTLEEFEEMKNKAEEDFLPF